MPKKKPVEGKPVVHPELDGFEMSINEFGEITTNTKVDVLNDFLNKHVEDKKFHDLDEIPYADVSKKSKTKADADDDEEEEEDEEDLDDDDMDDDELDDDAEEEIGEGKATGEKDLYDLDDKDHDYEDIEDLVKNMEKDFGKKAKGGDEEEEAADDFVEEEFLDEYNDDFSEEDSYNLDEGEDDKY
ncbi:MAG: hypothetical protein H7Y00_00450 [Fimbriimonadaceae bacterium]|nr:hypothetical protein [Chitinophagales bacterium]